MMNLKIQNKQSYFLVKLLTISLITQQQRGKSGPDICNPPSSTQTHNPPLASPNSFTGSFGVLFGNRNRHQFVSCSIEVKCLIL